MKNNLNSIFLNNNFKAVKLLLLIFFIISQCSYGQIIGSGLTDIDGNNYTSVIIGNQEWMSENLKVTKYSNGDIIPNITQDWMWYGQSTGAFCWYNNNNQFDNEYGKLYNWFAAVDIRNVCPTGWKTPSNTDWFSLIYFLDSTANNTGDGIQSLTAGGKLKETGFTYWASPNTGATNTTGFSARGYGTRGWWSFDPNYQIQGLFWSSTEQNLSGAFSQYFLNSTANSYRGGNTKQSGFAIRCMRTLTTALITTSGSTTFCSGDSVVLTANLEAGLAYQWKLNGTDIIGATSVSYTANTTGLYAVEITDNSNTTSTSSATTVTVNPLPTVTLTSLPSFVNIQTPSVALNGSPTGGSYSGQGISGTNFIPSAAGLGNAAVSYSYTSTAGCSGSIVKNTIVYDTSGTVCTSYDTIYTSINDTVLVSVQDTLIIETLILGSNPVQTNEIKVYPNPAHSFLEIDNGNFALIGGYTIRIENSLGQVVFNQAVNQQLFSINLSTWTGNGIYYLHIINSNGITQEIKKIVLQ